MEQKPDIWSRVKIDPSRRIPEDVNNIIHEPPRFPVPFIPQEEEDGR